MSRLKVFMKYFLAVIIAYIVIDIISVYLLRSIYITKEYSIENSILDVEVTEVKATTMNGYIKGNIKNNTDVNISNKFLKLECYSSRDVLVGLKYFKINNLNAKEADSFNIDLKYNQIDNIKISVIDIEEIPKEDTWNIETSVQYVENTFKEVVEPLNKLLIY